MPGWPPIVVERATATLLVGENLSSPDGKGTLPAFRDFARNAWPLRGSYTLRQCTSAIRNRWRENNLADAHTEARPIVPSGTRCLRPLRATVREASSKPQVRRPMVPVGDEVSASVPRLSWSGSRCGSPTPSAPTSGLSSRVTLDRRIDNLLSIRILQASSDLAPARRPLLTCEEGARSTGFEPATF